MEKKYFYGILEGFYRDSNAIKSFFEWFIKILKRE